MTKDELIKRLEEIGKLRDTEIAHAHADDALIEYINDKKVELAYLAIDKWYA